MIIGVFGDSFAKTSYNLGWAHILERDYSYTVKNYGLDCTSLFWSYRQLQQHINEIDTIIFVITSAGRLYAQDINYRTISAPVTVKQALANTSISDSDRVIYKAAYDYYMNLDNMDFNYFVHDQIIKEIQALALAQNKKLILVPAFLETVKYQSIFKMPLYAITAEEHRVNFNDPSYKKEKLTRANHLSDENNEILAGIVSRLISGTIDSVTLNDFSFIKYKDPSLYWDC